MILTPREIAAELKTLLHLSLATEANADEVVIRGAQAAIRQIVGDAEGIDWDEKTTPSKAGESLYDLLLEQDEGEMKVKEVIYCSYDGRMLDRIDRRDLMSASERMGTVTPTQAMFGISGRNLCGPVMWTLRYKEDRTFLLVSPAPQLPQATAEHKRRHSDSFRLLERHAAFECGILLGCHEGTHSRK